jgi:hypothetical protein
MSKISRPNKPLADVNVITKRDGTNEVVACFMPDPDIIIGEGNSKAFLALDASLSLKKMYGFGGPFGGDPNYVQSVARKIGAILTQVTRSGSAPGIYWAVSPDGSKVEEIGEYDEAGWESASITGPKNSRDWGKGTKLLSTIKYSAEVLGKSSDWTMGVIITDGIIEDEKECIDYCLKVGKEITDGKLKPIKLVLIGIGEEVDEGQLERLDDMFEGTNIDYDLWSHGMVASMKDEADILAVLYGEIITEDTIIAPTGRIETKSGKVIKSYSDGMPGKIRFTLPKGETEFIIKVAGTEISQDITEGITS